MASNSSEARIDTASRIILATPKSIYQAMTDSEAVLSWRHPKGMTARFERFDPRPNGGYRMTLFYPEELRGLGKSQPDRDIVEGRFIELTPYERIVEDVAFESAGPQFAGTMRITTTLNTVSDGTKVTVSCENVPAGIRAEVHAEGLASTLKNLALFIE
ncbi:SRPBCC domain-containing protein [Sphingomonas sp. dw_22]|uniref:SRPBCC domain-containing protein n=1 Tax=Sphingomonas sp. dw_22 TaxID=2721175 RepID=UPI001BD1D4A0|nr:SRPBCC domain-containing protein [Sphingomonas sp. dw_22]